MLLKIICRRRHIEPNWVEEESEKDDLLLSNWVLSCVISGKLEMVVGHEPEALSDFKRFERMALVGLWCINLDYEESDTNAGRNSGSWDTTAGI